MKLALLPIFLAAIVSIVSGQCPTPLLIEGGSGDIQSPNYGAEYGKVANCTWSLSKLDWTKYALKLQVENLRLYIPPTTCVVGSYNLSINGELLPCNKFARKDQNSFCHSYYTDESCSTMSEVKGCEIQNKANFPVDIKYNSDGRTPIDKDASTMWGFGMTYEFIQCLDPTTTVKPAATTVLAEPDPTTILDDTTTLRVVASETTADEKTSEGPTTTATDDVHTTTSSNQLTSPSFALPTIYLLAGGGGITLLLIGALIISIMRLRQSRAKNDVKRQPEDTQSAPSSGDIRTINLPGNGFEETPYSTMNGSGDGNNSMHGLKNTTTDKQSSLESNQNGVMVTNVYTNIPKKFQSKKTGKKKSTISSNQHPRVEISTNHQPKASIEQEGTYTIMTGGSDNSPIKQAAHTEDNTYIMMTEKQPHPMYAVSKKSKAYQSSNEAEQDPTYTVIGHTPSNTTQVSTAEQNHNDRAHDMDVYATIQNNHAEITTPTTQSEDPLFHHTPKQEDAYTVMNNSAAQSENLYAAVENDNGVKKTMHYQKQTKDNIIYVPAP